MNIKSFVLFFMVALNSFFALGSTVQLPKLPVRITCISNISGSDGPATISVERTESDNFVLKYKNGEHQQLQILAGGLKCIFSPDPSRSYVSFCSKESEFLEIIENNESKFYTVGGENKIMSFELVRFSLDTKKPINFTTRKDNCSIVY